MMIRHEPNSPFSSRPKRSAGS
uniref:Uncharacterized protein n=1 Tax=Arundo donax TaxID=35708 RepID=A0A0A8ZZH2_ARUDO